MREVKIEFTSDLSLTKHCVTAPEVDLSNSNSVYLQSHAFCHKVLCVHINPKHEKQKIKEQRRK